MTTQRPVDECVFKLMIMNEINAFLETSGNLSRLFWLIYSYLGENG